MSEATPGSRAGNAGIFFFTLVALGVLRIVLGFVSLPIGVLPAVNGTLAAIYLGVPIVALFFAAKAQFTARVSLAYLIGGTTIQVAFWAIDKYVVVGHPVVSGICQAIAQIGLPAWCAGLGALVALKVKDKNMLVPLAIFLAFFDAFMVFSPFGLPNQVLQKLPQVFESVAGQVPAVGHEAATGKAIAGLFVGPADFVFIAMYFVVLFKFGMRTKTTLALMIPVLVLYLLMVVVLGKSLPALIPIGAVVLVANWKEFKLTRDEMIATAFAAALGIGLYVWGMSVPAPKTIVVDPPKKHAAPKSPQQPEPEPADWA